MLPQVWVDADACPVVIKEVIIKAARRTGVKVTFVANSYIRLPELSSLKFIQASKEFDAADNLIVEASQSGDLAITQDIPLASELLEKGLAVITPRGKLMTNENIKSRLNMRDFMETMRASGIHTGGPSQLGAKEKQEFSNQFDKWLTKNYKK